MKKRTVKFKYEDELKKLGVLEQFEHNFRVQQVAKLGMPIDMNVILMNIATKDFEDFVTGAFRWDETPEGGLFWKLVSITEVDMKNKEDFAKIRIGLN